MKVIVIGGVAAGMSAASKIIREVKDEIKRLDREYGRLSKLYNEVKESKEDRKNDLLELKELKLKEIALIEEELKNIG